MQVKRYLPLFRALKKLKPEDRKQIIEFLDKPARESVYTLISSVLKADKHKFKQRRSLVKKLSPFKQQLRFLIQKKNPDKTKTKLMREQIGGFPLGLLLSAAIPLISSLVTGAAA